MWDVAREGHLIFKVVNRIVFTVDVTGYYLARTGS